MTTPEPVRGPVWDVDFQFGSHPAVVMGVNAMNSRLGHVAVIPITGTQGPPATHIPLDADTGLTRCDESFADVTSLRPVARGRFAGMRGLLALAEVARIETQLRTTSASDRSQATARRRRTASRRDAEAAVRDRPRQHSVFRPG